MKTIDYERIKALLLDLDGTLINSEKAFCNSFIEVFKKIYGIDVTYEEYKKYELEQNAMLIKVKKQEYDSLREFPDSDIMNNVYNNYDKYFIESIHEKEALDNFDLIKKLKEYNLKIALVTTCRWKYLNELIKINHLSDTFDYIVGRDDVKQEELKPNPKAYYMVLENLQVNPENCLAIEDSKRGIDASLAANIPTIKVEEYTSIKYKDDRVIECYSANEVLKKILEYKRK